MFYLTSRDAKTVRRTAWRLIVLMAQAVVFIFVMTLSLTYVLLVVTKVGMRYCTTFKNPSRMYG